jgi:pimeloyl-ACP methyl ester carboxylesterase
MDFIEAGQIRIAYKELNPEAEATVFFIHGNSGSYRTWNKQLNSELFNNYHLVAFDLPGCGESLIPAGIEWDYSPLSTGKVIAEVIKQLAGNKPYCLVGFSYGSIVLSETLNYSLTPAGISLLGSCVIGDGIGFDKLLVPGDNISFHDEVSTETVKQFLSGVLKSSYDGEIIIHTEDFFLAKPPFRSALGQSIIQGKHSDGIALLKSLAIPVQLIFGKEDNLLQVNYLDEMPFAIWKNEIYKLPGAGHYLQNDQPEVFNQLLAEYLEERFKAGCG